MKIDNLSEPHYMQGLCVSLVIMRHQKQSISFNPGGITNILCYILEFQLLMDFTKCYMDDPEAYEAAVKSLLDKL